MTVLHAIHDIDPKSGGPTRSVTGICRAIAACGVDAHLYIHHGNHTFVDSESVVIHRGGDRSYCASMCDFSAVLDQVKPDVVHLHGLWQLNVHADVSLATRRRIPVVLSPRGMLDPWSLGVKRFKKQVAMALYQRRDLNKVSLFHVTAQSECDHVREAGFTAPCVIISNGVLLPETMPDRNYGNPKTAIFLSRLHPGKGLLTLAEAWAKVRPQGWVMKVVGPDSYGHKAEVIAKLDALGIRRDWEFVDTLDDAKKWLVYRSADLLVHPSVSENFGITVAEGLAAGLPAIATKGAPWQDLETHHCGWWIEQGVDPLAEALQQAVFLSDESRERMGANGVRLIANKYSWMAIGRQMTDAYENLLGDLTNG